jgi:hypothetical protein
MPRLREVHALILGCVALACGGCDASKAPPPAPAHSASVAPLYEPPPPEGCARTGSLEAVEADPACVVGRADEVAMRDAMKHLTFELKPDSPTVTAGGTVLLRLTITNGARSEVALLLDAQPAGAGPRPDWSRLAGVPEPKPAMSGTPSPPQAGQAGQDAYRLNMPVRTLDAHEHSVDGLPTTPSTRDATSLRSLRVRLRPGGKLTQTFTWWALRIPAPGPITRDDAGHRFVPKTTPVPLVPGEYVIDVDLPLHGITASESVVTTRVKIEKPDLGP